MILTLLAAWIGIVFTLWIAGVIRQKLSGIEVKNFKIDYQELPSCPNCGVGMDYQNKECSLAKCHDCKRVYPRR